MRTHVADAARLLKTPGNKQRSMVLRLRVEGEHSMSRINLRLDLSQSALSQHLAVLREHELVATRREARTIHCSPAEGPAQRSASSTHCTASTAPPTAHCTGPTEARRPRAACSYATDACGSRQQRRPHRYADTMRAVAM